MLLATFIALSLFFISLKAILNSKGFSYRCCRFGDSSKKRARFSSFLFSHSFFLFLCQLKVLVKRLMYITLFLGVYLLNPDPVTNYVSWCIEVKFEGCKLY